MTIILSLIAIAAIGVLGPAPVRAADPLPGGSQVDVRMVVDVSAAMTRADPSGFRAEAVALLSQLLPTGASAGIWTYARYVNLLVPHDRIDAAWRERAVAATRNLPDVGGAANLSRAVREASWDGPVGTSRQRHLILMTDGRLATGDGAAADETARAELAAFAADLRDWGVMVHVLRLPGPADPILVKQLALATGGHYRRLDDPAALDAAVQQVVDGLGASSVSTLPVSGQAFQVDPGIDEITVLRLRDNQDRDLAVVDPGGRVLSRATPGPAVRWHEAPGYDLLTISRPRSGQWYFTQGALTGSRVYAASDLELHLSGLPATVFPGALHSFRLELRSAGQPIQDDDFLRLARVSAVMETDDGEEPILVEALGEGDFLLKLLALEEQGEHRVRVSVSGPTFERQRRVTFVVRNPVSLEILPGADDRAPAIAWITLNSSDVNFEHLTIIGLAKQAPRAASQINAQRRPGGLWKLALPAAAGALELVLDIKGKYLNGKEFLVKTEPVVLTLPLRQPIRVNMDMSGARILGSTIPAPGPAPAVPQATAAAPPPIPPVADSVMPAWFAAVVALVNALAGFGVYFLLRPPARPEPFFESLAELESMLPEQPAAA